LSAGQDVIGTTLVSIPDSRPPVRALGSVAVPGDPSGSARRWVPAPARPAGRSGRRWARRAGEIVGQQRQAIRAATARTLARVDHESLTRP